MIFMGDFLSFILFTEVVHMYFACNICTLVAMETGSGCACKKAVTCFMEAGVEWQSQTG